MHFHSLRWLALAIIVATLGPLNGCAVHTRVYDSYYHDYHRWNNNEVVFYSRWENETHREHRDFRDRDENERKEYWGWRHTHDIRDHDRDRNHDRH